MEIGKETASRITAGSLIVLLFLAVFSLLVWIRQRLPKETFQDVQWMFLIALVAVLPFFLEYARPLVSSFEIPNFLKIDLRGTEKSNIRELKDLVDRNVQYVGEAHGCPAAADSRIQEDLANINLKSYADILSRTSSPVIQKIKEMNDKDAEILPIDLGVGKNWLFINLYFLALLSEYRTKVSCFVFIETAGGREGQFIGLIDLSALLGSLSFNFPLLAMASLGLDYKYGSLDDNLGKNFFNALNEVLPEENDQEKDQEIYRKYVTAASLNPVLETDLQSDSIEYKDELTEEDLRKILCSPGRFTAVVEDGKYLFAMDKEKVSMNIAKKAALKG